MPGASFVFQPHNQSAQSAFIKRAFYGALNHIQRCLGAPCTIRGEKQVDPCRTSMREREKKDPGGKKPGGDPYCRGRHTAMTGEGKIPISTEGGQIGVRQVGTHPEMCV